jgi:alpha-glucosidase
MNKFIIIFAILIYIIFSHYDCHGSTRHLLNSPDGKIELTFELLKGIPNYSVKYLEEEIIVPSSLGFSLLNQSNLEYFDCDSVSISNYFEEWKPVWGQSKIIINEYSEKIVSLTEKDNPNRKIKIVFRVFNDGVAFRFHFEQQVENNNFEIADENTYFNFSDNHLSWWVPNDYDSYEYLYRNTQLSKVNGVNTPFTIQTKKGTCIVVHEAELKEYSGLTLEKNYWNNNSFKSVLVPSPDSARVKLTAPFDTPWRVVLIAANPGELIYSNMILNLNPPPANTDLDWIQPAKYVGIWWGMHLGKYSWTYGANQGATTENVKKYIDFASKNNIQGVLVEGWNKGWEKWGQENAFSFTESYSDFDIKEITRYASEKGVVIIGHHETGGDVPSYETQLDDAFKFYAKYGINIIKTGYAGPIRPKEYYHHGQKMVEHYNMVVQKAFENKIMLDVHEPIQMTGLSRTYPNLMTCEGTRGMEWNAWSIGNTPEHTTILPFTRNLAGPIDYTPGIFDLKFDQFKKNEYVKTTLTKQLALYITIYSPFQMAADLIENYDGNPAFDFIKNVLVDWDTTVVLNAAIGEYLTIARSKNNKWYIGSITDENPRELNISFDFLEPGVYLMKSYNDGKDADYILNPNSIKISEDKITPNQNYIIQLAPGGGFAAELLKIK